MKAIQLIESAPYGPATMNVIREGFDEAWDSIAAHFGDDPSTVELARIRLAYAVLNLPVNITGVEQIKTSALEVMALLYRPRTGAGLMTR